MLLGVLLGLSTVLVMSILNLILISYIGCSYMSIGFSEIGICLSSASDIGAYSGRIMFIIKTGIEYEKKADYESLRNAYGLRSQYPDISDCMFALPQNGQEIDVLSNVSRETIQLLEQLRYRSSTFCRDMM